ncbi:MAG TPA: AsmA-like C-terminal region-containing protein [Agriterribacter sp.]|nr:AsmA-like C-terminal region-containing protein [Agriterribacter sp.]
MQNKFNPLLKLPLWLAGLLKYTGAGIAVLLLLMFLLPLLFPGFVTQKIKQWANRSIETELNFSGVRLSFFNHFPSLTLTLYDVTLRGSAPYREDTLLAAREVALGVNVLSVLSGDLHIDEIYLTSGKINVQVNEQGMPNYNVYVSEKKEKNKPATDSSTVSLKLERIQIEACELVYHDRSVPFQMSASRLDYVGKGDLTSAVFELSSKIKTEGLHIRYDHQYYLRDQKLAGRIRTLINTHSLSLVFAKNRMKINRLPVSFTGRFDFLKDGYSMDFLLNTRPTAFENLFSAFPPAVVSWLGKTIVKGEVALELALQGDYIAAQNKAPDFSMKIKVTDGLVRAKDSREPVKNIFLALDVDLPNLDRERLAIKLDSLHAGLGEDELTAVVVVKGFSRPLLEGNISAGADLEKWNRTLNFDPDLDLKGILKVHARFNGAYDPRNGRFPVCDAAFRLKDGYIKTGYYPRPLTQLQVSAGVTNATGSMDALELTVRPASFYFEEQPFTLACNLADFDDLSYEVQSKGILNIGKIYRLFAVEGYDVDGMVETDISLKGTQSDAVAGRYEKLDNRGHFTLRDIQFRSDAFPQPFHIRSGIFHFERDNLVADSIHLNYGSTHAAIKGRFANIINYVLKDSAMLIGKLNVYAKHLRVDEWMTVMPSAADSSRVHADTAVTGVVVLPRDIDFELSAVADSIAYPGLDLLHFKANAGLRQGQLELRDAGFSVIGTTVQMKAAYAGINEQQATFDYQVGVSGFDIKKAWQEIKLFREMAPSAQYVEGTVSLDYRLSGLLDANMYPHFASLKGGGVLLLKKVKVKGLKLFSAISDKTNTEKLGDPDLSDVHIKSTIADNIITIERVKLKVKGFRPRFEGQISFDGRLNLSARLGLPPFGLIGIPMSITGTQEAPVVKLRRSKQSDDLHDHDADEEDIRDAAPPAVPAEEKPLPQEQ